MIAPVRGAEKMKFGIFDHMDHGGGSLERQFADRLKLVEAYDRAGFWGYHLAEHHSTPLGCASSPGIFLAAVAARTHTIRFGPLVYVLPFYNPLRLVEEICMLDHLSGGRFQLGLGRGVSHYEAEFFGVEFARTGEMYHEAFKLVMQALASDELNFDGKFYKHHNVPMILRPLQKPHPPLWYATAFPDSAAWPAQNDINIVTLGHRASIRAITDRYRAERMKARKSEDTIPLMGVTRHVVVADTDDQARAIANRAYKRWRENFTWAWRRHGEDIDVLFPMIAGLYPPTFDELQEKGNGVAGSPQTVRDYVATEIRETGINYLCSWLAFGDTTLEESLRSVELFKAEIMPAFEGSPAAAE
jgi:alkanesulfonate monooxygenase SsuD/methylene tetrahydromethanopterin reductase-like flavin-dependent oxidoreductase (luciferase family)